MTKHTFKTLMQRLSRIGFKRDFVRDAILPDWWDDSCADDSSLLQDIEIRVARFLGLPLAVVMDASAALTPPEYPGARLRRVREMDRKRLGPAIHSAMRIAAAVARSLRDTVPEPAVPPPDGLAWRKLIDRARPTVTLEDILSDLWLRGIPVIPLEVLPVPSFQGIACYVEGRPVVLLGHKHDEPGRVSWIVAHEAGHIAARDCAPNQPVVDEEEEIADGSEIELLAERFATQVLIGAEEAPPVEAPSFKLLASRAAELERTTGADASSIIFAWAARTRDYANATMAVKALYRAIGARRSLRQHFDRYVDLETASESDRALLRCVYGDPERDESPR